MPNHKSRFFLIIIAMCVSSAALWADGATQPDGPASAPASQPAVKRTHVTLLVATPDNISDIAERHFSDASREVRISPLPSPELDRTQRVLQGCLKRYSKGLLLETLDKIVLCGDLHINDMRVGGTYRGEGVIYLRIAKELSDTDIERKFHHEYSSVLKSGYSRNFKKIGWENALPKGFAYKWKSGLEAVQSGQVSIVFDPSLYNDGFICTYATATMEEDFNCMASEMFVSRPEFWQAVDSSALLAQKVKYVMEFYSAIGGRPYTEEFFRNKEARQWGGPDLIIDNEATGLGNGQRTR